MELHELAQYCFSRTRRMARLAIFQNGRSPDVAHDEQTGCTGTFSLTPEVEFSFGRKVSNLRVEK
jgi:hypothetical protein